MRTEIESIFKDTFRDLAIQVRDELGITQARMSEALLMSERSYEDIESGRSSCGAITMLLIFLYIESEQRDAILEKLKEKVTQAYLSEVALK